MIYDDKGVQVKLPRWGNSRWFTHNNLLEIADDEPYQITIYARILGLAVPVAEDPDEARKLAHAASRFQGETAPGPLPTSPTQMTMPPQPSALIAIPLSPPTGRKSVEIQPHTVYRAGRPTKSMIQAQYDMY